MQSAQEEVPARPGRSTTSSRLRRRRSSRPSRPRSSRGRLRQGRPGARRRPRQGRPGARRRADEGRRRCVADATGRRRRADARPSPPAPRRAPRRPRRRGAAAEEAADAPAAAEGRRGRAEPKKKGSKLKKLADLRRPRRPRSASWPSKLQSGGQAATTGSRPTSRPPAPAPVAATAGARRRHRPTPTDDAPSVRAGRGARRGQLPTQPTDTPVARPRTRRSPTSSRSRTRRPRPTTRRLEVDRRRRRATLSEPVRRQRPTGRLLRRSRRRSAPTSRTATRSGRRGPSGISARGTCHHRMTIRLSIGSSRQTSPTVSRWSSPVCATRTTSASGAASSAARKPPGPRRQHVGHRSARVGHPVAGRACAAGRSPARAARGVKLPPSGKITNASFSSRPVASAAICASRSSPGPGVGRDEPGRDPVQQHVDRRVPGQRVLEDDPRLAVVPVHQRVDQHERVARVRRAGSRPAAAGPGARPVSGPSVSMLEPQHPPGLAEEHPHHALHQVVVDALEVRRPDPPAEPATRASSPNSTTSSSASQVR